MGANLVRRLVRQGHDCVVFDQNPETVAGLVAKGITGATDLADLVAGLARPRNVWVMLPAGDITEQTVAELGRLLEPGDTIIDGGNAFFQDDVRRAREMKAKDIHYLDCGTSGGVWGLERGYLHCGPSGAGHFVKMVHNGIEYGLMQAYAEGFEILRKVSSEAIPAERRYDLDLADIAEVWRRGSVVSSWLLDLTSSALAEDPALAKYSGFVENSGEGRWTINAAIEEAVPADVLSAALYARFRSRDREGTANKLLSAMRHAFGGHVEPKK